MYNAEESMQKALRIGIQTRKTSCITERCIRATRSVAARWQVCEGTLEFMLVLDHDDFRVGDGYCAAAAGTSACGAPTSFTDLFDIFCAALAFCRGSLCGGALIIRIVDNDGFLP